MELLEQQEISPGFLLQRLRLHEQDDPQHRGQVLPGLTIALRVSSDAEAGAVPQVTPRQEALQLVLRLNAEWLQQMSPDDARGRAQVQALQTQQGPGLNWQPSARARLLAHQILHAPAANDIAERLYLKARALEIVAEALTAATAPEAPKPSAGLSLRHHRRMRHLQAQLDSGALQHCSSADIARRIGMSLSGLQRAFKAFTGQSLVEYRRARRLDAARHLLEREGWSVAQAAAAAGYGNAANFATAFKRRFGCCPSQLKTRD